MLFKQTAGLAILAALSATAQAQLYLGNTHDSFNDLRARDIQRLYLRDTPSPALLRRDSKCVPCSADKKGKRSLRRRGCCPFGSQPAATQQQQPQSFPLQPITQQPLPVVTMGTAGVAVNPAAIGQVGPGILAQQQQPSGNHPQNMPQHVWSQGW